MNTITKQIATWSFALASLSAFAVYEEGQDRPVMEIRNAVVHSATNGFDGSQEVNLIMTRRDGAPNVVGFRFEAKTFIDGALTSIHYQLEVSEIQKDEYGATVYYASLPAMVQDQSAGHRVNLTLIDHSTRSGGNNKPYQWEARIRDGFGWCGTMDSVIEFSGDPNPVFTITQLQQPRI